MGILEWMYHYLFVVMQVLLVIVGSWMIAYWFGLKQKKSVMFVSSSPKKSEVISEPISSPSISKDEIKEVVNEVVPDNLRADNKSIMPEITHDSKQVQVDLTPSHSVSLNPSSPPSLFSSSSIPCSTQSPTNDVRDMSPEVLAREERRRRRDERRAARAQYSPPEIAYRSPLEYLEDRCKLDVNTYYPYDRKKKCLVLDIDYTIFDHKSDFDLALEFKRPYLHEFLKICGAYYNIVIWSATAFFHIQTKMEKLQLFNHPDFQICFVLSKDHMIPHGFSIKRKTYFQDIKPLSLLWMKYPEIFTPDNTIHIDDVEENFVLNPGNGLRIEPFREALLFRQTDRELFYLAQYLTVIADLPSFSNLNHNKWKDYIINTLWSLQTVLSLPTFTIPEPPTSHLLEHHHQSLVTKQKMKERAKEHEREERMNRHMEEEKRKSQLLVDATLALGQVEKNMNNTNNMNNINVIKEATEDELIKLAKEAMERKHNNKPSSTPPRSPKSPSIRTPPKSPSHRSPLLSPSSSSSPSPSALSFSLSPSISSSSSPSPSGRSRQNHNQFPSIPNTHNFPTSQPSLSLSSPSPPKDRRHIVRNDENTDNREKQDSLAVKGLREATIEKECLALNDLQVLEIINSSSPSSPSSSDSFISLSLPAINPIAHAAN